MALGPRLDLRQSQSLVMTPQLQQAIRLLALSNLEIESFIAEEVERNPLLEVSSGDPADQDDPRDAAEIDELGDDAPEPDSVDFLVQSGDAAEDAPLDIEYEPDDYYDRIEPAGPSERNLGLNDIPIAPAEGSTGIEALASTGVSLHDHLLAQAGEVLSGTELVIAAQIIEQIDETGYFRSSLLDISQRLKAPLREVERVLSIIHTFDPAGVGARSLSECLALQAKDANRYDPAMARLIDNLDCLAKGNLAALKRICGVDDEDLTDMIRELKAYDPKPGCRFQKSEGEGAVIPDVFVFRRGMSWIVELNSATLPRLLVNRGYYAELSGSAQDRKSRAWLSDCLANANWLLRALDQRARTIVKVATEIVKQQDAFFRQGVEHLRPLTLRSVADVIGMHESTVSRVTSNKYIACDRGVFELKYFFSSGVQSADGQGVSAEAVKSHIRALIAAERPDDILSDDQIVETLQKKGFDIARRTVAKYRESMGIGSSVQRRRHKAIERAS